MNSVRAYFGDPVSASAANGLSGGSTESVKQADGSALPAKAANWLKMNGLTGDQLESVFHFENEKVDLIAEVPGKSNKEKTYNVYVLAGAASLVATGNAHFEDDMGRQMCERAACYDQANHATHMKNIGGVLSGDKKNGWTLTQPGLKRAAALIKEITAPQK